jgi:MSHA biogenesis protein MshI
LFKLLKKAISQNVTVAICPGISGMTIARVRREPELPPVLEVCESYASAPSDDQAGLLASLRKQHHLDEYPCVSVMDIGSYHLLLVEAPDVQPAELRAAIRWRVKDLIDFHLDDAVIDVFEVPHQKAAGRNRMMYAVVAKSTQVKKRIDELVNAGINLSVVDIPELVLRNIAALLPEDVGGVALLYLTDDTGIITLTRQGTLYLSRQIDIGTNDLAAGKDNYDSLVVELQRSLDYYESHFSQPAVSSVVITPMSQPLPGLVDYLQGQLDLNVRMMDLNQLIDIPTVMDEISQAQCLLAIGAALREEVRTL